MKVHTFRLPTHPNSHSPKRPMRSHFLHRSLLKGLSLLFLSALTPAALSDISVPAYFSEHMMLQADAPAPVWGWADPGETVTATFAGQTQTSQTDDRANGASPSLHSNPAQTVHSP